MKIKTIQISGFRKILKATIHMEDDITVIAGANNSGKTSIVELFNYVFNAKGGLCCDDFPVYESQKWCTAVFPHFRNQFNQGNEKEDLIANIFEKIMPSENPENEMLLAPIEVMIQVDYNPASDDIRNFADYIIVYDELFIKAHRSLILLLLAFRPANASLVYRTRRWGAMQKYPNGSRPTACVDKRYSTRKSCTRVQDFHIYRQASTKSAAKNVWFCVLLSISAKSGKKCAPQWITTLWNLGAATLKKKKRNADSRTALHRDSPGGFSYFNEYIRLLLASQIMTFEIMQIWASSIPAIGLNPLHVGEKCAPRYRCRDDL